MGESYKDSGMNTKKGKLFVVSAPSGAGKTTLVLEVLKALKGRDIHRVVTFTSKKPSSMEVQGIDYHFVSSEEFKVKIEEGFFIEYSLEYGAYYGFPKSALYPLNEGRSFIAIVDKQGAFSLKAYEQDAILIRIEPPDEKALEERLACRARDSESEIAFRLSLADKELRGMRESSLYSYVIVNNEFDKAVAEFERLIRYELGLDDALCKGE